VVNVGLLIAGAGPCGIGAAWTAHHEFPEDQFVVVDANLHAGGCASSETTPEGFTFDYGGHVLFPHQKYKEFAELLGTLIHDWDHSVPVRGVYLREKLIPFPIQRNVHRLPLSESAPILADLLRFRTLHRMRKWMFRFQNDAEETLAEYLNGTFGRELTKRVMEPLNQKMWTLSPGEMSSVWVRDRSGSTHRNIPQISLRRLLRHAIFQTDDLGWTASTKVRYPAAGGTGAIWRSAYDRLNAQDFKFGRQITAINTKERRATLSDGAELTYSHLISTMPLDVLLSLCRDRPEWQQFAEKLRKSSALLFGYGLKGILPEIYQGVHTFQCPERDLPFWRVTIPSNVSSGNVPVPGHDYSVLCEISCESRLNEAIDDRWRKSVLDGLRRIGLISPATCIVSTFEKSLKHGYPLPFLGRDELLAAIQRELSSCGILSRGRFGGWRYEISNQDHAFMQGVEAVRFLIAGKPESTYPHSASVN
jgi:protoporphyrinogen oxidase